jgi:hypothetical protein
VDGAHGSPDSLYVGRRDAFDETVPGRRRWSPEEALEDEEHHEDLRDDGRAGEQQALAAPVLPVGEEREADGPSR